MSRSETVTCPFCQCSILVSKGECNCGAKMTFSEYKQALDNYLDLLENSGWDFSEVDVSHIDMGDRLWTFIRHKNAGDIVNLTLLR
jgi:hypothetical protein